jgi:uncharacterized protein (UPF0216 family)
VRASGEERSSEQKVVSTILNDITLINQSIPKRQIALKKALEGNLTVELKDGSTHYMEKDELLEFYNRLPKWMRWIVKVPIIIIYNPKNESFTVSGDEWQEEAVRTVLGISKGEKLKFGHLERLIMEYGSFVFVAFVVDVEELT